MTGWELYNEFKGYKILTASGAEGVVCGFKTYPHFPAIMAVTSGGYGWDFFDETDNICYHKQNKLGYLYVQEKTISRIISKPIKFGH